MSSREDLQAREDLKAVQSHPGWVMVRDHLRARQHAYAVRLTQAGVGEETRSELAAGWRELEHVLDGAIRHLLIEHGEEL